MKSNKEYWNDIEKDYQTSGLSRKEFAQVYGISYSAWIMFNCRQRKHSKESVSDTVHFLKLAILSGKEE